MGKCSVILIVAICSLTSCRATYSWPTMLQKLSQEKQLSQFFNLLQNNKQAKSALMYREITIFAPTNRAFDNFEGSLTEDLVLYHLIPLARTLENLDETSLAPILEEHPPVWISKNGKDTYVNNAKVMANISNYMVKSRTDAYGRNQILHVIDEVLNPMAITTTSPTAYDFLLQPNLWELNPYTFNTMYKKIMGYKMQINYKAERRNTYFISADQFVDQKTVMRIDKDIIDANIIANRVVFMRSAYEDFSYVTRNVDRDYYNTVSFFDETVRVNKISKRTLQKVNEKMIKILIPNIPVKNGVVHIVKEVLGIFEKKLTKFPFLPLLNKIQTDPNLNISSYFMEKSHLSELIDTDASNFTIFIPDDTAWINLAKKMKFNVTEFNSALFNSRIWKIMRRHVIFDEYFDTHRLIDVSKNLRGKEVLLDVGAEKLMVRVTQRNGAYWMKWGFKDFKLTRPNYECTNGILHIIDSPLLFDSDLKGFSTIPEHQSILFKTWNVLKKILV